VPSDHPTTRVFVPVGRIPYIAEPLSVRLQPEGGEAADGVIWRRDVTSRSGGSGRDGKKVTGNCDEPTAGVLLQVPQESCSRVFLGSVGVLHTHCHWAVVEEVSAKDGNLLLLNVRPGNSLR